MNDRPVITPETILDWKLAYLHKLELRLEISNKRLADERELNSWLKHRIEQSRTSIHNHMEANNWRQSRRPDGSSVVIVPGRPAVVITDETELPDYYVRIKREPDKTLIGAALKAGEAVPGAVLSNQPETVRIRT